MIGLLQILFWASLAALVWTHLGYPLFVAAWSRLRPWPVAKADVLPTVSLIIPAYNEQDVIEAKLENALELDYPRDRVEIVVTSDASTDATHEIVRRYADRGVHLLVCDRGGKVAAQDRAVRETTGEVVAFGDANVRWDADALLEIAKPFADARVG
ncbi:MAG TPA: glycosyltransferase, partial [Gaiellales bacterium]|nr:glycosyltransferase [Gaiellales bacterium]